MIGRCIATAGLIIIGTGCGKQKKVDTSSAFTAEQIRQGVALSATYCSTCHGIDEREMEDMLAPPLWSVRAHYLARYPEPEAFVVAIDSFLTDPKAEHSLMPKAVDLYGLKAPVGIAEEDLRLAASAIYAGAVERPSWTHEYKKLHKDSEAVW